jgi:uncharacterized membrane protein YtjA (UPF0391 family)
VLFLTFYSAPPLTADEEGAPVMLGWALVFAIVAIAAFYFGFFALAGLAASIAKILFLIFLVLLVVSFIVRAFRGGSVV